MGGCLVREEGRLHTWSLLHRASVVLQLQRAGGASRVGWVGAVVVVVVVVACVGMNVVVCLIRLEEEPCHGRQTMKRQARASACICHVPKCVCGRR